MRVDGRERLRGTLTVTTRSNSAPAAPPLGAVWLGYSGKQEGNRVPYRGVTTARGEYFVGLRKGDLVHASGSALAIKFIYEPYGTQREIEDVTCTIR